VTYPTAGYGYPAGPPPIDSRALRPGRGWYAVAIVIAVLGIVVGVAGFGLGIASFVRGLPKMTTEFDRGSPVTVHLAPDQERAIYVDRNSGPGGRSDQAYTDCTGTARGDGSIDVQRTSSTLDFPSGRHQWLSAYSVTVTRAGDYELSCEPRATDGPTHYALGDAPKAGALAAGILGGTAALIGVPCLALTVGGVIALVVALRRSSAKKRLQQQYYQGYPPPS
jgi:hypothetical protein